MSIKSTHGNGQKTLVRIEWNDGVGGAVRRAEFEDSDDEFGDGVAGPAWCIYYALDMLHGGCQLSVAEECARALALCEEFDDVSAGDKPEYIRERQLLKTAHGERFRSVRLSLGLTLRRTAELTGMSMTQVSMIERGEIMPSTLDVWPLLEFVTGKLESYQKVKP